MEKILDDNSFIVRWNNNEGGISEGPLSVLWNLIESYRVDIFDVKLSQITADFLQFIQISGELSIDIGAEFTLMAANLVYLKSRALLPDPGFEEEDYDPPLPPELVEKLLEFKKFQMSAKTLSVLDKVASGTFSRESNQVIGDEEAWLDVSLIDLIASFQRLLIEAEEPEMKEFVMRHKFTVVDKISWLEKLLDEKNEFEFTEIFSTEKPEKMEIVVSFLALLEIVKAGYAIVRQHKIFGDIKIIRIIEVGK